MSAFLSAWLPVFPLQAAAGGLPREPAVVSERNGPLDFVVAANRSAQAAGIQEAMAVPQALGRCPRLVVLERDRAAEERLGARLLEDAGRISPRVQSVSPDLALLDFTGLDRLHGSAEAAARRLEREFNRGGWSLRTGIAAHPAMALIAGKSRLGSIPTGTEAPALAPLPIALLGELGELTRAVMSGEEMAEALAVLDRWGIHTLGALAALPRNALSARMGKAGAYLQAMARGKLTGILHAPAPFDDALHRAFAFDSPIGDLETIKAAVAREAASLEPELERHDRVVEHGELRLNLDGKRQAMRYARSFAVPTRDPRTLTAQLHLALERDPPRARVQSLHLRCVLARPRRIQARLFAAAAPDREKMPKLLARLGELLGTGDRVGSPFLLDTHRPGAFAMKAFAPPEAIENDREPSARLPSLALRIFRPPRSFASGEASVLRRAGPWRSRGGWWRENGDAHRWDRDEWDAEIRFPGRSHSGFYRLGRDLENGRWYLVGQYD